MNKSFKTLFTLFLVILFFIPTFTANSKTLLTDKRISKTEEKKCIPEEKSGFKKIDGKTKYFKKKICISVQDVAKLGIYQEFNDYPEGMLKEFKQCKKFLCQSKMEPFSIHHVRQGFE